MLLGLPHHLAAVAERARRAAFDPLRIRVEADAKRRVSFRRDRAQRLEVAQASKW